MLHKKKVPALIFIIVEAVLYYLILTAGGDLLRYSSYAAIVLCFLFALLTGMKNNPLLLAGLAFTVCADFCLVICDPIQRLWGMVFFLMAQTLYAIHLHKSKLLLLMRILLIAIIEVVAIVILGDKLDALAIISVCYYANLVMNIAAALAQWQKEKKLSVAFVLFLLCDTVIGLQVAAGAYLPIGEETVLHNILFMDFNLSWMFYLPSQMLIALRAGEKEKIHG